MSDREQIGFRFPPGTRARIEALRLERESLMGVLLRGLDLLEQQQPEDHQTTDVDVVELARRVERLERQIDTGKPERGPISDRDQRILVLKAEGVSNTAIGREVGITEGAVRGVLKKYPDLLRAEIAAKKIIDDAASDLERITG